jgi:O-antigen/teichoic acid export membrane protein
VTASTEGSALRVVRNTITNAGGRMVNAALAFILTPILLHQLGATEYGIWVLGTTLTFDSGYLNLAELGLQQAAVRLVADARSRDDHQTVSEVVSTATVLYAMVGVVLAGILAVVAGVLTHVFHVTGGLQHVAMLVFLLVGVQIAVDLPAAGLLSFVEGSQRYGLLRAIDVGGRVLWAVATIVAVEQGHGVLALAVLSVVEATLSLVVIVALIVLSGDVSLRLKYVSWGSVRRLTGQGVPMLGIRVLGVLYSQMDRVIVGAALGAAAVANYEVAYKLHATAALTLGVAPSAILPAAAYIAAANHTERLRELFVRGTKYAIAGGLPIAVAGMLYAKPIIVTWVGASYGHLAGAARLFLLFPALAIALVIGQTMLMGLGRMRRLLVYQAVAVSLNLALSIVLVDSLGITGVIWGTIAAYAVLWVPLNRLFLHEFGISAREWAGRVILPNAPGLAVQLALGFATLSWVSGFDHLWEVAIAFAVNCGVSVAVFVFVALGAGERHSLLESFRGRRTPAVS